MKTLASDKKQSGNGLNPEQSVAEQGFASMLGDKFVAIPMWIKLAFIVLLLSYAVAINMELSNGTGRYIVHSDGADNSYSCLEKDAAIRLQMKLERKLAADKVEGKVTRQKMNVVSKWFNCSGSA